jgi:hypothetical protein
MGFDDLPLFSAAGEAGKVEGMARASQAMNPDWQHAALQVLQAAARARPFISANDLWDGIETLGVFTHENRASGPVMTKAKENGWIAPTDRWIKSSRPSRHQGDVRLWRSLLHPGVFAPD